MICCQHLIVKRYPAVLSLFLIKAVFSLSNYILFMEELLKTEGEFQFIDQGSGEPLILLHGLFGALSNFKDVLDEFSKTHRVLIPMLPL